MRLTPVSPTACPDLPFRFIAGDGALDFVNTTDWTDAGPDLDRMPTYERLVAWAAATGFVDPAAAGRLVDLAANNAGEARSALEQGHTLRWMLQRLFTSIGRRSSPEPALSEFNDWLGEASRRLRVVSSPMDGESTLRFQRAFEGLGESLDSPLWPVVWSASELLTSEDIARVRACAAPQCGWLYVDRSRNGLRRWCQMETCGTRAKGERRRRRERARA